MSKLKELGQSFGRLKSGLVDRLKKRLFGPNLERLDFLIDSFNKLSVRDKLVFSGVAGFVTLLVICLVGFIYLSSIYSMRTGLSDSLESLRTLESYQVEFQREDARFKQMVSTIRSKSNQSIKAILENINRSQGLEKDARIQGGDVAKELPKDDPLGKEFKYQDSQVSFRKISVPKLLKYLVAAEQAGKLLQINKLAINEIISDAGMYFRVSITFRAYVPNR